jgi:hypothetical protein
MSDRWKSRILAACALSFIAASAGACAVAPEDPSAAPMPAASHSMSIAPRQSRSTNPAARTISEKKAPASNVVAACTLNDPHETNDAVADATALTLGSVYYAPGDCWDEEVCNNDGSACWLQQFCDQAIGYASTQADAALCNGDEDWYFVPTEALPFDVGYVRFRAFAAGASYCPFHDYGDGDTYGYDPPSAPENTLTVEVYNASTLALVASSTSTIGRVWMDLGGPENLSHDLYFRFLGPQQAQYTYNFSIGPQTDWFEDECEY